MANLIEQVFNLIELQNSLIAIESPLCERLKLLQTLTLYCTKKNINCYLWTLCDDQLHKIQIKNEKLLLEREVEYIAIPSKSRHEDYFEILRFWKTTDYEGLLILEGIFPWLTDQNTGADSKLIAEWIKSALCNLKFDDRNLNKTAILLGPNATVSSDIAPYIPTITQQLPTTQEISAHLATILKNGYNSQETSDIANSCVGMYLADIEYGIKNAFAVGTHETARLIKQLSTYRIDMLKRVYNVEFVQPSAIAVGGLELMQSKFALLKRLLNPLARRYNLRLPKGVLLVGPPGTGKSYSAKACSQILGFPLIILEWSSFRSYGNQAEYKLKNLLALVDRLNRVTLYLDDFDKGFAGNDDLSRRLAGMLLTWMQERSSEALVIASVNNIDDLPVELTRAGRFDDIFKVDLPNNGERHAIFKIHLARFDHRFRDGDPFTQDEWRRLLKETQRCVGAEIQNIVERAARNCFYTMFPSDELSVEASIQPTLEITLDCLLEARRNINPLAIREADKVERMRNKASTQGLPSSSIDDSVYSNGNISIFS